jgi:DNA-directed RNA polymerase specialized sigma subunit
MNFTPCEQFEKDGLSVNEIAMLYSNADDYMKDVIINHLCFHNVKWSETIRGNSYFSLTVQEGVSCLIIAVYEALKTFDKNVASFNTYLTRQIRWQMGMEIRREVRRTNKYKTLSLDWTHFNSENDDGLEFMESFEWFDEKLQVILSPELSDKERTLISNLIEYESEEVKLVAKISGFKSPTSIYTLRKKLKENPNLVRVEKIL